MDLSTKDVTRVAVEIVRARGHPNVRALHRSTVEITKENYLTERGDCIIAISADKSANDLSSDFKEIASLNDSLVIIILVVDKLVDMIIAEGSRRLTFSNEHSLVIRKSNYVDDRTIALKANKAARDINREIIRKLRESKSLLALLIAIKP